MERRVTISIGINLGLFLMLYLTAIQHQQIENDVSRFVDKLRNVIDPVASGVKFETDWTPITIPNGVKDILVQDKSIIVVYNLLLLAEGEKRIDYSTYTISSIKITGYSSGSTRNFEVKVYLLADRTLRIEFRKTD